METLDSEQISPEKAIEILKKEGLEVDTLQAKLILEFLYKLADIAIAHYMRNVSAPHNSLNSTHV